MSSYRFHKWVYGCALPVLLSPFLKTKFHLVRPPKNEDPALPDTFLLISNHVTNYDPFIVGLCVRRHMYFVASDHILNLGFKSKLIKFLTDPIPRPKGGNAAGAVMEILRRAKEGRSVALFAEGNCSWNGETASFAEATGKMVRASRTALVTFRIEGGYFAYPRWAYSARKGRVCGRIVHVYSPEELRAMKPEEINRHIAEDIHEDSYARMEQAPSPYPGKDLAKGIEHALIVCPNCRRLATLRSEGSRFFCSCGLEGTYNEYAALSGSGFSFPTLKAWDAWQKDYLAETIPSADPDSVLAFDEAMTLYENNGHKRIALLSGPLSFSRKGLRLGERFFPLEEISDLTVRLHGIVSFSLRDGSYFDIQKADRSNYSGRKYKLLFDTLTAGRG